MVTINQTFEHNGLSITMKTKTQYAPIRRRYISHSAKQYWERGWLPFPLAKKNKKPPSGFRLNKLLHRRDKLSLGELAALFQVDFDGNIAIATGVVSGILAVDSDSHEEIEFVESHFPKTPFQSRTGRGRHDIYRLLQGTEIRSRIGLWGRKIDLKSTDGYIVAPPSIHPNGTLYEWITPLEELDIEADMPIFDPDWLPQSEKKIESSKKPICPASEETVRRARKYLNQIICISGKNAHNTFYRAICKLVDIFNLSETQILELIGHWNKMNCFAEDGKKIYEWSDSEISHKVNDVLSR